MHRVFKFLSLVFILLGLCAQPGLAKGHGGGCPPPSPPAVSDGGGICIIPVTTIIGDTDSNGLTVDIGSDGQGPYPHNVAGVTSWLTSNGYNGIAYGDWQFSTVNSTTRTVGQGFAQGDAVQLGDPHAQNPFVAANPPYWGMFDYPGHIEVKCTLVNRNMLTMTAGSSFTCPLIDRIEYSSTAEYRLEPAFSFTGYPETTDVQVRCNTTDSNGCNDWFIDPINLGEAVGRLTGPPSCKRCSGDDGDFYMRFHIHVTRP
jgi:hypothetical protein